MLIEQSISNPPPFEQDFNRRLKGPDKGLINAWLAGISYAQSHPVLAERAKKDELPALPYKGGVEKVIKTRNKIGALHYLAMWQGMRGEDLKLDMDHEPTLVCQRTGVPVTFTLDIKKLFAQADQ